MRLRWASHPARKGEIRNTHMFLVRKPERMSQHGSNIRRWEDNINAEL